MFPFRDKTRRYVCRGVFLLAGVLPMLAALAWATTVNTGAHLLAVRDHLAKSLGLEVRLEKVSYPRPGVTRLSGLELADPDTGETVASTRLAEIDDGEHGRTIILSQPKINTAQAKVLWTQIDKRLREQFKSADAPLRLTAGELTLRANGSAQTLTDCSAQLESDDQGDRFQAAFHLANIASADPLILAVSRGYRATQLSSASPPPQCLTTVQLHAESAPLPCGLILAMLGRENHLGSHSTLRGTLQAFETPDGWQTEFAGKLQNIDINAVITDQFPHQLSGTAELTIDKSVIHSGRLIQAAGKIHAGPGIIGPSLLMAAADSLGMRRGFAEGLQTNSPGGVAAYDVLAAAFRLDANGLTIRGNCGGDAGVVVRSQQGILLGEAIGGPVPMVALIKTLVPDSRVQVPATRQTDWLLNLLPIPDVVPHDPQSPPQAKFHGRDLR